MRGRRAAPAGARLRMLIWPEAAGGQKRSRLRWIWTRRHHCRCMLAAIAVFAAVVFALAGCRGHGTTQPIPPGWVRYRVDDLFTIDLPEDAHRDPRPGIRIDWYPGDDDRSGDILGTVWRLRWCWWREARGAKIMSRTRDGRPARGVHVIVTGSDSLGRALILTERYFLDGPRLLSVGMIRTDPSDSILTQRTVNSVRFPPADDDSGVALPPSRR